ncbi:hypothetical protein FKM82_008341 [Ascaphus truei]
MHFPLYPWEAARVPHMCQQNLSPEVNVCRYLHYSTTGGEGGICKKCCKLKYIAPQTVTHCAILTSASIFQSSGSIELYGE